MSHQVNIQISDAEYETLKREAARINIQPGTLARQWVQKNLANAATAAAFASDQAQAR